MLLYMCVHTHVYTCTYMYNMSHIFVAMCYIMQVFIYIFHQKWSQKTFPDIFAFAFFFLLCFIRHEHTHAHTHTPITSIHTGLHGLIFLISLLITQTSETMHHLEKLKGKVTRINSTKRGTRARTVTGQVWNTKGFGYKLNSFSF